jgi:hypothetical protein
MMEAEKINEMLGWANAQTGHGLLRLFFNLVTENTPSDKTALLKHLRIKFRKCLLRCR